MAVLQNEPEEIPAGARSRPDGLIAASQRVVWPVGAVILILVLLRLSPFPLEHVFIILFTSILLAAAVSPAATFLARYQVPRALTILLVYIVGFGVIAGAVMLLVPLVTSEVAAFEAALPGYLDMVRHLVARVAPAQAERVSVGSLTGQASGALSFAVGGIRTVTFGAISFAIDVVLVLVMAFFMAHEENFALRVITRFVPERGRARAARLLGRMGTDLGHWARAQLLLALFFGVAFGLGLWVIGINYAATLGVVGGILEIIPYVGGFLTMVLAVLIALTKDPLHALYALGWYAVVAEVEAHVVHPNLMNRFVRLHPLVVVVALFLGGEALGIVGALLAVPIAVIIQILLNEFYPGVTETPEKGPSMNEAGKRMARRLPVLAGQVRRRGGEPRDEAE